MKNNSKSEKYESFSSAAVGMLKRFAYLLNIAGATVIQSHLSNRFTCSPLDYVFILYCESHLFLLLFGVGGEPLIADSAPLEANVMVLVMYGVWVLLYVCGTFSDSDWNKVSQLSGHGTFDDKSPKKKEETYNSSRPHKVSVNLWLIVYFGLVFLTFSVTNYILAKKKKNNSNNNDPLLTTLEANKDVGKKKKEASNAHHKLPETQCTTNCPVVDV